MSLLQDERPTWKNSAQMYVATFSSKMDEEKKILKKEDETTMESQFRFSAYFFLPQFIA